jgi:hypothetical protein
MPNINHRQFESELRVYKIYVYKTNENIDEKVTEIKNKVALAHNQERTQPQYDRNYKYSSISTNLETKFKPNNHKKIAINRRHLYANSKNTFLRKNFPDEELNRKNKQKYILVNGNKSDSSRLSSNSQRTARHRDTLSNPKLRFKVEEDDYEQSSNETNHKNLTLYEKTPIQTSVECDFGGKENQPVIRCHTT